MPIDNHSSDDDISSPGLDLQHRNIIFAEFGADRHRNDGGVFGLLFKIASWMASEVLAGCAAYAEAMYPMYIQQDEQPGFSDPVGPQQTAEVIQIKRASESCNPPDIKRRKGRSKS
jgi:hypothetical protein